MNTFQIVIKTIVSTINAFIAVEVLRTKDSTDNMKKIITIFTLINLTGVWI